MSNLTTLPKGDSAWLLRKSIQRIMQQVSVLETNIGSSTTGNSSDTQIIFNDAGTLRGDSGLTYNKTTDLLSVGAATITGDLTVDTNTLKVDSANNRVGIGTASPSTALDVFGGNIRLVGGNIFQILNTANDSNVDISNNGGSGVASMLFKVAGTSAMTLNSTGLGVGVSPASDKLLVSTTAGIIAASTTADFNFRNAAGTAIQRLRYTDSDGGLTIGSATGVAYPVNLGGNTTTRAVTIDASSNVGIGVTPSAKFDVGLSGTGTPRVRFTSDSDNPIVEWQRYQGTATNYYGYRIQGGFGALAFLNSNVAAIGSQTWTQAMTLDASGNLLVGTTSSPLASRVSVGVTNGQPDAFVIRNSAATAGLYWRLAYVNSANTFHILNQGGVGVYLTDGATSWTGTSDERLKDIIEPISNAVAKVGSLRSVIGKFKTDSEGTRRSFLIAQDVQAVLPEAVDTTNADAFGVRYSEVIPLLVAAIKELTARVQTLENR